MRLSHISLVHLFVPNDILQCSLVLHAGLFIFVGYLQMGAPIEIESQGQRADLGSHHLNLFTTMPLTFTKQTNLTTPSLNGQIVFR